MKKIAWALSLFSMVFVSSTAKMYAQSAPEYTIASPGYISMPFAVNCDMFETGPNQLLKAVVWNDGSDCYLFVEHNGIPITTPYIQVNPGTTVPGTTMPWLAWQPDVVIGEDPSNPNSGVYYIAVVYWDDNHHQVYLSNFQVDLNAPPTVTPITTAMIGISVGGQQTQNPHIDMIPDPSTGVLHEYVVVYDVLPGSGSGTEYGFVTGEISASSQIPSVYNLHAAIGTGMFYPDVAGFTEGTDKKFCVAFHNTTGAYVQEWIYDPIVSGYKRATPAPPQSLTNYTKYNRIEAMNVYDQSTNPAKWMVAGMTNAFPAEVWAESNTGLNNCSASTDDDIYPVVAAGIGSSAGNPNYIGNSKYVVGWCINITSPNPVLNAVDISLSNMMGAAMPVTSSPVYATMFPPMAISSSSNTGNGLLTAWYDLNDIKYKVSATGAGSPLAFKPTSVNSLDAKSKISLYPNPATDQLNIANAENTEYSITSVSGVQLQQGKIESKNASLNINSLPAGIYMLELKNGEGQTKHKFVKQ